MDTARVAEGYRQTEREQALQQREKLVTERESSLKETERSLNAREAAFEVVCYTSFAASPQLSFSWSLSCSGSLPSLSSRGREKH
jgi:hypothetical protein